MKIIAVSGVARSGKDTISDQLAATIRDSFPNLNVKRESLAFFLKQEMAAFLMEKFGVDIFTIDGAQKERFRPLLVAYGYAKRLETKGTYFTNLLQQKMQRENADIYIISDLRYAEHEADELSWLREQKGKLIHIKRFNTKNGRKVFVKPPNEDERKNDPILEKNADFRIMWESAGTPQELSAMSKKYCEEFVHNNIKLFIS